MRFLISQIIIFATNSILQSIKYFLKFSQMFFKIHILAGRVVLLAAQAVYATLLV